MHKRKQFMGKSKQQHTNMPNKRPLIYGTRFSFIKESFALLT